MPNHLHVFIDFSAAKTINNIVSNAKRFMAYTIVERFKEQNNVYFCSYPKMLVVLIKTEKLHQVFEKSFDCKEITSKHFYLQKISYIHNNPCSDARQLAEARLIIFIVLQSIMLLVSKAFTSFSNE